LAGIRIIEIAGIGPGPFAGMMLADHGAEVIRVERPGTSEIDRDVLSRSRQRITLDLKQPEAIAAVRALVRSADGLIEGFRPGTMERLGLGPDTLLIENPKLVYGRMTGWGQTGPYAPFAGHDLNYIALSGALHSFGRAGERPVPPANLVGDFGGGGMLLAFAMVSAILHARSNGQGQVVDCAMTEGSALLMSMIYGFRGTGQWRDDRGTNLVDTGAHFYDVYETADGRYISVGAIEPQFYRELRSRLELLDDTAFDNQLDPAGWPSLTERLAALFRTKTRDEWCALLEHSDVCFAPVLSLGEAPFHPHNVERGTFLELDGIIQPAPAPHYSATPLGRPVAPEWTSVGEALVDAP